MKTIILISTLNIIFVILFISSCATTPKTQEEKGVVGKREFFQAVKSGDIAEVKRLIDAGADVNTRKRGYTALMHASRITVYPNSKKPSHDNPEVVQLLIEEGADVNAQNRAGYTTLMIASGSGTPEVARLLIEAGADANAQDNYGETALMWASRIGNTEVAKLLIEEGADVNVQNRVGNTALMIASKKRHDEIVSLLREAGAKE